MKDTKNDILKLIKEINNKKGLLGFFKSMFMKIFAYFNRLYYLTNFYSSFDIEKVKINQEDQGF